MRLLVLALVCAVAHALAAPIVLVSVDQATHTYSIPPTIGHPNGQARSKDYKNLDVHLTTLTSEGIDLSNLAPGFVVDAALIHAVFNSSIRLRADARLEVPVGFELVFLRARVDVIAKFKVDAPVGQRFDVYGTDHLTGTLRTQITETKPQTRAYADAQFETYLQKRRYSQERYVGGGEVVTDRRIFDLRNGTTDTTPGAPEFTFATPGSFESAIDFNSGPQYLTTVLGGVPFVVKASLWVDVNGRDGSISRSNFFDSLQVGLEASPVPEPNSIALAVAGLALIALRQARLRR